MREVPSVSVVIPTFNRPNMTVRAVESALGQTCGGSNQNQPPFPFKSMEDGLARSDSRVFGFRGVEGGVTTCFEDVWQGDAPFWF